MCLLTLHKEHALTQKAKRVWGFARAEIKITESLHFDTISRVLLDSYSFQVGNRYGKKPKHLATAHI